MRYEWQKIKRMAETNMEGLIFNSELNFTSQVSLLADMLNENTDCKLILVVGPSSSGKSTFTSLLKKRLEYLGIMSHTISTDDFFIDRDKVPFLPNGLKDFDSIAAVEIDLLRRTIKGVLNGEWVEIPYYDFLTGKSRLGDRLIKLHKEDIVILEGIHAFNPTLLENVDDDRVVKVSIAPRSEFDFGDGLILYPDELRLIRRTIRDYSLRGHDFKSTIKQWEAVLAAEKVNIHPYVSTADFRVDSVYPYELFAYKHCVKDNLKEAACEGYEKIVEVLDKVPLLPLATVPNESLLNEFVHIIK